MSSQLEVISPKFFTFLRKHFSEYLLEINEAFDISIQYGGLTEINFTRAPSTSFNPRNARIPQLSVELGKIERKWEVISAILFSSSCEQKKQQPLLKLSENKFGSDTSKLLEYCFNLDHLISGINYSNLKVENHSSKMIVICSFVDRFRHSHLVSKDEIQFCLERLPHLYCLIPKNLHGLQNIFSTWEARAKIILTRNTKGNNFE